MSNIAISELDTETNSLDDNDLLLVSKNNGSSYTSAKMKGSVLKSGTGTCQASSALTSYGTAKTSDVTSAKNDIQSSISGLNNLSSSQVQTACSAAISSSSTSVNVKGIFIDPTKFSDGYFEGTDSSGDITLPYDSVITLVCPAATAGSISLHIEGKTICNLDAGYSTNPTNYIQNAVTYYVKKNTTVSITIINNVVATNGKYTICPLG